MLGVSRSGTAMTCLHAPAKVRLQGEGLREATDRVLVDETRSREP